MSLPPFGHTEYKEYARLFDMAEAAYASGNKDEAAVLYEDANRWYTRYEYAAGIKSFEEY